MKTTITGQVWMAIKIWFIAIAINTVLGTFYMTDFFSQRGVIGDYLIIGTAYGAIYSFPVIAILLISMNRSIAAGKNGLWLFRMVLITGIVLTVIASKVFFLMMKGLPLQMEISLLCIAVLSGIAGITSQSKALINAGKDFQNNNNQL
jgi:hypothetical protein